jgi:hypothetical protein
MDTKDLLQRKGNLVCVPQVTCVGSKAPGEVLANLIIATALFLIFEVQFLEVRSKEQLVWPYPGTASTTCWHEG